MTELTTSLPGAVPTTMWEQYATMTRQFAAALTSAVAAPPPMLRLAPPPAERKAPGERKAQGERKTQGGANHPNAYVGLLPEGISSTIRQFSQGAAAKPAVLAEEQAALARDLMAVLAGTSDLAPAPDDKRFSDTEWAKNPFYRRLLQSYLAWSNSFHGIIDRASPDERSAMRMGYLGRLVTDALAPSNTLLGNPAALKKAAGSGGASVVEGLRNALADLVTNNGMPSQVDKSAFTVGGNLAITPGAVVFRTPVLEVIQYTPCTAEVQARPQILVPPHVNRFYLLDMAPGRSMAEFLVERGFQVFTVSWRNPSPAHRKWGMDVFAQALKDAIAAVKEIGGSDDVNIHGICGGARTLAALLGHLAAIGDDSTVNATTAVVCSMIAEEDPLGPFADAEGMAAAKRKSAAAGVLDGAELGRAFTWAKPNDLVWNYWVNNYLLGDAPAAFDILFWNSDTTRLTATLHAELLDIFSRNLFAVPGGITILGTPIDLSRVRCDAYVVAGLTDHIGPWKSVYNTVRVLGGDSRFVLSSGGHVQSIITPPANKKVTYYTNNASEHPGDPEAWLATAEKQPGSWWLDWASWLEARSGERQPAPMALGSARHPPLCPAPGTYVLEK